MELAHARIIAIRALVSSVGSFTTLDRLRVDGRAADRVRSMSVNRSDSAPLGREWLLGVRPSDGDEGWWKQAVVYQVYCRSFADSNGDGIGDLQGLRGRLDYLQDLGIGVIWLSPVYRSPQDDNGYDISDYYEIDPIYGTLDEFDDLLNGIHERGMKLIMDLVVNHTSDEHPWFVESRSSVDAPKRDWYWWRPPRNSIPPSSVGAPPNNWASFFSGSAWEFDPGSGEYYLHLFSRKQPDLNWENGEVRQAIYSMMRWWLDRGVDGFRMDVINMISKDPRLPDGPTKSEELGGGAPGYVSGAPVHDYRPPLSEGLGDGTPFFISGPRVHEYLQEMHHEVFDGQGALLKVGETPGVTIEQGRLFTDPATRELDMVFQFEHVTLDQGESKWDVRPLRLADLKATMGRWQQGLGTVGWNSLYWSNHDQPRAVSRFGQDGEHREASAKMLATVLHLHRGTPFVYQGEELGMTNADFEGIDSFRDIETLNHYASATTMGQHPENVLPSVRAMSRDNARTPMQWDASSEAGFTSGTPWIPINANYRQINAAAQLSDPQSILHHYRALVTLRRSEPVIVFGDFTMLLPNDERVYAFIRRWESTEVLVLGNFSSEVIDPPVPDIEAWASQEVISSSCPRPENDHPACRLHPWEARVYRRAT